MSSLSRRVIIPVAEMGNQQLISSETKNTVKA